MLLPILWFLLLLSPFCYGELECVKCDGRVVSPDKTCTNCTGDYCFIVKYNNRHTSLKAQQSFFQGCLTFPTDMPLGCSQNNKGSVFCICNSTNNCNEFQNVRDEKNLTYLTCQTIDNAMWPIVENCVQPWCYKKSSSYDEERVYCTSQEKEIEMYDIGFVQTGMLLPINACYSIQVDSRFEKDQYCVYKTNKTTPFKQKVPGNIKCYAPSEIKDQRMKNSTCVGQFCFSAEPDFGCISQFNKEGAALKAGLYHLTPFITPFHICDSDFCNNQTIADDEEDRYSYPTRYVWSSGIRASGFIPFLILIHVFSSLFLSNCFFANANKV
ncbi:hypothetical protein CRE_16721 [Caenorhabditis remanei]|uniref:DUF7622 domain-containing protein n=1 Tax=Caenorhabditis remanei TaxID=31234 RepID=E3MAN5_CAERE|nr:hypothetical protein CRE_16721 [Caenorhabditis remanei]